MKRGWRILIVVIFLIVVGYLALKASPLFSPCATGETKFKGKCYLDSCLVREEKMKKVDATCTSDADCSEFGDNAGCNSGGVCDGYEMVCDESTMIKEETCDCEECCSAGDAFDSDGDGAVDTCMAMAMSPTGAVTWSGLKCGTGSVCVRSKCWVESICKDEIRKWKTQPFKKLVGTGITTIVKVKTGGICSFVAGALYDRFVISEDECKLWDTSISDYVGVPAGTRKNEGTSVVSPDYDEGQCNTMEVEHWDECIVKKVWRIFAKTASWKSEMKMTVINTNQGASCKMISTGEDGVCTLNDAGDFSYCWADLAAPMMKKP